ncbi:MAG: hypothetical protein MJ053_04025 [Elusimicrobiaceae bacterium]|nr:hypothetical protein [Elusimicrobiaceae bacterium]
MEIREPHSLSRLFVESFGVMNRVFDTLCALLFVAVLGGIFAIIMLFVLNVPKVAVVLFGLVYSSFLLMALLKTFAGEIEQEKASFSDLLASSALPGIYTVIVLLIYGVLGIAVSMIIRGMGLPRLSPVVLAVAALVGLLIFMHILFAIITIALREQDPFHAILYSCKMQAKHFLATLAAMLMSIVFPLILIGACTYVAHYAISTYTSTTFDPAKITTPWTIGLGILLGVSILIYLSMHAFLVSVFLNLDYRDNDNEDLPATQHARATLAAPEVRATVATQNMKSVQVLKASVKTHAADESISQHLSEVYQPKPEDIVTYTEEDRMPTILFDDEMAAQLAQERAKWEQEKAKSQALQAQTDEDDDSPIKMSK